MENFVQNVPSAFYDRLMLFLNVATIQTDFSKFSSRDVALQVMLFSWSMFSSTNKGDKSLFRGGRADAKRGGLNDFYAEKKEAHKFMHAH